MIKFVLTQITPYMASQMLEKNEGNRKLNQTVVRIYAADMKAKKWRLTHQAIAIDEDGKIIDGQHRLYAIIASDELVTMYVAEYQSQHSVLSLPIDLHKKRSQVDVLKCDHRYVEVVNTIYWLIRQRAATTAETESAILKLEPYLSNLHEMVTKRPKIRGSAGARTGVLYRMMQSPVRAIQYADLYRDFCLLNFDELNSSVQSLIKVCELNATEFHGGQAGRQSLIARTVYAFNLDEQHRKIIRISKETESGIISNVREFFRALFES